MILRYKSEGTKSNFVKQYNQLMESNLIYHQGAVYAHIAHQGKRIYHNTKVKVPASAVDSKGFVKKSAVEYASKLNELILEKKRELDTAIMKDLQQNGMLCLLRVKDILSGKPTDQRKVEDEIDFKNAKMPDIFKRFMSSQLKLNRGLKWRYETLGKILLDYTEPVSRLDEQDVAVILEYFYESKETPSQKVSANTAALRFKNYKRFHVWARRKGYPLPDINWDQIRPKTYKSDFIVISEDRIQQLWDADLKGHHDRVRKIFLILIYTGMRYSDFLLMRNEDIQNGMLKRVTQKTNEVFEIPIHNKLLPIIMNAPKMAGPVFNRSIKELGKTLGWTEEIRWRVSLTDFEMVPFYTKLKSHVGRHTAASRWLQFNIPLDDILLWTGWSKSDMIFYYGKHSRRNTSEKMNLIP